MPNTEQPFGNRVETLSALTRAPLDLLVIGGGIVGAGVARDAALRGLKVGLIEQHDFAFGTSSRSSRLLHGGLRYLAQGRLGLVHEASVEKGILQRIAPHLTQPLPFIFPTYQSNKEWVLWQLKLGVKLYDLLCHGRNLGPSTWLSQQAALQAVPGIAKEGLNGAVRYYDGLTNDARLVLDTLRSAAKGGAHLLNYCQFQGADRKTNWECRVRDQQTGDFHTIQARSVVNATGPWADRVPHSRVRLRLTKGVHAVVNRSRLPVPGAVVMTAGKRILFAIPWEERTILGTTDTDYDGSPDLVIAEDHEIRSVLEVANQFFPGARLTTSDVISTWAGLRPLIADPNGNPSNISRAHEIRSPEPGWWDVAGGKLTTYRLIAEQTADRIARDLSPRPEPCKTAAEPLLQADEVADVSGIAPPRLSREVVEHYCRNEWAVHLSDVMLRRTSWHYYHADSAAMAADVATWMGDSLGWSDPVKQAELEHYRTAPEAPFPLSDLRAKPIE